MTYMKEQELYKLLERTKGTRQHQVNLKQQMAFDMQERMGALLGMEKKDQDFTAQTNPEDWMKDTVWNNFKPVPQPKNGKKIKQLGVAMQRSHRHQAPTASSRSTRTLE